MEKLREHWIRGEAVIAALLSTSCKGCGLSLFLFSFSWVLCLCVPQSTVVNSRIFHLHLEDEQWRRKSLIRHVVASLLKRLWALHKESWCISWGIKVPEEVVSIGYRVIAGDFHHRSLRRYHRGLLKYLILALCNCRKQIKKAVRFMLQFIDGLLGTVLIYLASLFYFI